MFLVTPSVFWLMNKSWFCVFCRDMSLSTVGVILLLVYLFYSVVLEIPLVCWLSDKSRVFVFFQSIFCVVCRDMFLSADAVILLVVYFFNLIFLETPSVRWWINQSRVFVYIFDYMEYPWLQVFPSLLVLDRTEPTWLRLCQDKIKTFLRIFVLLGCILLWIWYKIRGLLNYGMGNALTLIEYQRLVECWFLYCSEIDRRSEACLMLGWIMLTAVMA